MWLSSRQFGSSTVTGKLEDKDTILTVAFLTKIILTVAYLTKMVFTVAYLSKTFFTVTHIWPRLSLQLHTWPRSSLQLYDQNDAYSCIFDQDDFYMTQTILTVKYLTRTISVSLNFTTSFQSPALPFFAHISQLSCFQAKKHETEFFHSRVAWNQKLQVPSFKPKYMRWIFCTVMWHGSENYRFPVYKPKYMRWGFRTPSIRVTFWMEAKLQVSPFKPKLYEVGISHRRGNKSCRFLFSGLKIHESLWQSCGVEAEVTGFIFQA